MTPTFFWWTGPIRSLHAMEKIYRVNIIYALLLIAAGLVGFFGRYLDRGDWQYTSLIPAAFGVVLLTMSGGMKQHNRIVSHLVVSLTFILAVMVAVMLIINLGNGMGVTRKVVIFLVVLAGALIALGYYVASFVSARRGKE